MINNKFNIVPQIRYEKERIYSELSRTKDKNKKKNSDTITN